MTADLVARLGSRALEPGEVRTDWQLGDYLRLLHREGGEPEVEALIARAQTMRRIDPSRLHAVLSALADPPTAELNKARIAALADVPVTTLAPYIDLLVALGAISLLPGCRAPVAKRAIGRPQGVFTDPALARHLAGDSLASLENLSGRPRLAALLRGLVAAHLLRQQSTSVVSHRVSYLRERNGLAVDLVIELPDDGVIGIEVRTAASLRPHQFGRLRALADRAGGRFRGGVVLNTATRGHTYGHRLWSLPIATVWD